MNEQQTEELYQILGQLIQKYTKGQTSQVSVEVADRIFQSIEYCIHLADKEIRPEADLLSLYNQGYQIGQECVQNTKQLWIKVKNSAVNVDNNSYRETIWNGVGAFLDRYSLRYAANEIPKELSYPLANPIQNLSGILYVNEYLTSLWMENQFMAKFSLDELRALFAAKQIKSPDLSVNLFELILTNAIGQVLLQKPMKTLDLTLQECQTLLALIASENIPGLQTILLDAANQLDQMLEFSSPEIGKYMQQVLKRLSYQWNKLLRENPHSCLFVTLSENTEPDKLELNGNPMSAEAQLECSFALNQSLTLQDKLAVLTRYVHSEQDLIACFDYFAGEEYYTIFDMINQPVKEDWLVCVMQHLSEVQDENLLNGWEQAMLEYDKKINK